MFIRALHMQGMGSKLQVMQVCNVCQRGLWMWCCFRKIKGPKDAATSQLSDVAHKASSRGAAKTKNARETIQNGYTFTYHCLWNHETRVFASTYSQCKVTQSQCESRLTLTFVIVLTSGRCLRCTGRWRACVVTTRSLDRFNPEASDSSRLCVVIMFCWFSHSFLKMFALSYSILFSCTLPRMPRTPQLGLAVNMGGDDRTSAARLGQVSLPRKSWRSLEQIHSDSHIEIPKNTRE